MQQHYFRYNRNSGENKRPEDIWEEKIYAIDENTVFTNQLVEEQEKDPIIRNAKELISEEKDVSSGQLRRVRKQLRIKRNLLTKSGRPIIPKKMQHYVTEMVHKGGTLPNHFGIDKTYKVLKSRFYWPNMFAFLQNYLAECKICNQCKVDPLTPRAPLIPITVPDKPMEFISKN